MKQFMTIEYGMPKTVNYQYFKNRGFTSYVLNKVSLLDVGESHEGVDGEYIVRLADLILKMKELSLNGVVSIPETDNEEEFLKRFSDWLENQNCSFEGGIINTTHMQKYLYEFKLSPIRNKHVMDSEDDAVIAVGTTLINAVGALLDYFKDGVTIEDMYLKLDATAISQKDEMLTEEQANEIAPIEETVIEPTSKDEFDNWGQMFVKERHFPHDFRTDNGLH